MDNTMKVEIAQLVSRRRTLQSREERVTISRQIWRLQDRRRQDRNVAMEAELLNLQDASGRPRPIFKKVRRKVPTGLQQLPQCSVVPGSGVEIGAASRSDEIACALSRYYRLLYNQTDFSYPPAFAAELGRDTQDRKDYANKIYSTVNVMKTLTSPTICCLTFPL